MRVVFSTVRSLNAKSKHAKALSALPIKQLVPEWVSRVNEPGAYAASLRSASPGAVADAENRLGFRFPEELRAFYEVCDGMEVTDDEHPYPFLRASDLRLAGSYSPSLSEQAEAQWREWGEAEGDPRAFRVFPSGCLAAVTDRAEGEMQFARADSLLALYPPEGARCLCIAVADGGGYTSGTVFEIENLTATRYKSLSAWLGFSATLT